MSITHISSGIPLSALPTGSIVFWAGAYNSIPKGWLVCGGGEVKQSLYPKLFAVISSYYNNGSETAGYFRLPALDDTYIRGGTPNTVTYSGSNGHSHSFNTAWTLNASGGNHTHNTNTLVLANNSYTHSHNATAPGANEASGGTASGDYANTGASGNTVSVSGQSHTHTYGITNIASNAEAHPHNTSNTSSTGATGSHSHTTTTDSVTVNTSSNNIESSYFQVRTLIKAS